VVVVGVSLKGQTALIDAPGARNIIRNQPEAALIDHDMRPVVAYRALRSSARLSTTTTTTTPVDVI